MNNPIYVTKFSGEKIEFNPSALRNSLIKSGAPIQQVEHVFDEMQKHLYDGITTRKLYQIAFKLLKQQRNVFAARYSLKKALRDLGPAGFYFEKWVAKLFDHYGFQTLTGQILNGKAVKHEVDVVAQKGDRLILAECKFRNTVDAKISVTTPMYFLSRIKDLSDTSFHFFNKEMKLTEGWLVSNAYLTKDAIAFAECYNIRLISWDYPQEKSIKQRVDQGGLYPITCLTTINQNEKDVLLQRGCVLVKDIVRDKSFFSTLRISEKRVKNILKEARELIELSGINEE
ncbi:putative nuclease [Pseudopedobacter saltans DSM 12145]|uniref:Nuclease n=1 Tax=Pseudopedobacter saltans (strain ATCC 51119 / DSM 12145 / JCM 21818 / CCUG 39354 / LMG 10337 / NBRC 100064 / NCIMB 13643) TaxID=762903 RepID=F0SD10_PSESL|nr:restriction endonuclease [Pseudopedobacter saltans]ADY51767.1 putative nuclease [Pseudopedobacter saltans DSM 12145]